MMPQETKTVTCAIDTTYEASSNINPSSHELRLMCYNIESHGPRIKCMNSTGNTNSTKILIPSHFIPQFFLCVFGECNDFFGQIHLPLSHRNPACAAAMHGSKRTERWKKNVWHHSKRPHFRIKRFHSLLNGKWRTAMRTKLDFYFLFLFYYCLISRRKKNKLFESFDGKPFDWLITSGAQKIKSIHTYACTHIHIHSETASESQSTETKTLRKHPKNENWDEKHSQTKDLCANKGREKEGGREKAEEEIWSGQPSTSSKNKMSIFRIYVLFSFLFDPIGIHTPHTLQTHINIMQMSFRRK